MELSPPMIRVPAHPVLTLVGCLGLLFVAHGAVLTTGLRPPAPLARLEEITFATSAGAVLNVVMLIDSVFLLGAGARHITVSADGISRRGLCHCLSVSWAEVADVHIRKNSGDIIVTTTHGSLRISHYYSGLARLKEVIARKWIQELEKRCEARASKAE